MLQCQQPLYPERGRSSVEPPRSRAKLREIAIDKAGIKLTLAESRRTTKRSQKAGIAAWADHDCLVKRIGQTKDVSQAAGLALSLAEWDRAAALPHLAAQARQCARENSWGRLIQLTEARL